MVNEADVLAAYRLILGREPESAEAISAHTRHKDLESLRRVFLGSQEFKNKYRALPPPRGLPLTAPPIDVEVDTNSRNFSQMIAKIGEYWSSIGETAPHWSVLTRPEYQPENIEKNQDAFFESSKNDEAIILSGLARAGMTPSNFTTCVEFGCGVGRLTFRLASIFPQVTGVDISAPHLTVARDHCERLNLKNVKFMNATAAALMPASGFDFWFSRIVLQHNPPPVSMEILRRVFKALPRGGVAMFQVPVYRSGYRFRVEDYLNSRLGKSMEMHCLPQAKIFSEAQAFNMQLLEVREDTWVVSSSADWLSNFFIFRKT